jgi:predicted transcriptional regulator
MRGGFDAERALAIARQAFSSTSFLVLLARTPQPDTGEHVLAHPLRRAILDAANRKPGLTMGELRELVPLGWGNGYHHLRKLERAGLIKKERQGRRLVITPISAAMDAAEVKARAYLKAEAAAAICADVLAHPGADVAAIADRTGLTGRSIYYHVKSLTVLGLVVSRSRTRQFALHATPLYERVQRTPRAR